ncbi:MAG TPA: MGMT family protein [Candidatus Nanoarchaeia archaeon]|nr:MGMT family protein [Candidatus Nanoarchaeia archaeon]
MFYEKVYEKLKKVPKGKVVTYKILAKALNSKAYRAVGTAMRKNPYAPTVPCHRVVKNNGDIGNFSGKGGVKAKIKLLEKEGVKIKNNKIIDFEKVLFKF